ncbi:hypothetical protein [Roseateles koreensis]|uniref:Sulfatase N-terminal domain-containing protein n=1 Tax=Roseateles koreensis TaxID=2987526 RepID=A0ABT5KMN3_9BURK|nr:hypothetical protein [Roseateles koreensis]MDC8784111.1 hypothetical protein [Roseateles koreensis]
MSTPRRVAWPILLVLMSAIADVVMVDQYYQLATETSRFLTLLVGTTITLMTLAISACIRRVDLRNALGSTSLGISIVLWCWLILLPRTPLHLYTTTPVVILFLATAILSTTYICKLLLKQPSTQWLKALTLSSIGFVFSQPLLADLNSKSYQWPARKELSGNLNLVVAPKNGRTATVFLLLDELNGSAAQPFVNELRQLGMEVSVQQLVPIALATSKVVPTMWTGLEFSSARPCSFTAICSGTHVLDFAKVTASRPDVDVVGFYHPYCAMRGLRYCQRPPSVKVLRNPERWICAVTKAFASAQRTSCNTQHHDAWAQFRQSIDQAIWAAPIWQQGGLLYAHVPLPHPPGDSKEDSLSLEYENNLNQAHNLVTKIANRLIEGRFDAVTFVIFSDHPLRRSLWCDNGSYSTRACKSENRNQEKTVPLISATLPFSPGHFEAMQGNEDIFSLTRSSNHVQ